MVLCGCGAKQKYAESAGGRMMKGILFKIIGTILALVGAYFFGMVAMLLNIVSIRLTTLTILGFLWLPLMAIPLIWAKNKRAASKYCCATLCLCLISSAAEGVYRMHQKSITINTTPNINVHEYLPFDESSKIVRLEHASLHLTDNLPRLDGAAAVFPVYSAFVHAVYPDTVTLGGMSGQVDSSFNYSNTVEGYRRLAEKRIDIFFGAYPSEEQREYAEQNHTTFEYIPIGYEAFVFFVNRKNPVDTLTEDQLRAIYSGDITNWSEVGGANREIVAYQRNKGSGSQSMLARFMGDTPIMEPPTEQVQDLMDGIIHTVSNYRNNVGAIGFSFRYYLDTLIANPNVKMLSVDGVYPSVENIKSGAYAIVTPLYAVTYRECKNENVARLIDWILSDEGQFIIEETGYSGIK